MIGTLEFNLATVVELAEHAITCTHHMSAAGPALLLSHCPDGIWLTSSGTSAPAPHPATRTTMAARAAQDPAPTSARSLLSPGDTALLVEEIPLHAHLLAHLRDGAAAGFTTFALRRADEGLDSTQLDVTISRRRARVRS